MKKGHKRGHQSAKLLSESTGLKWWHPFLTEVFKYYVDTWSSCSKFNPRATLKMGMEAKPTESETAPEVINWLISDLIWRFGVSERFRSDSGTHSAAESLREVKKVLWYQPQFWLSRPPCQSNPQTTTGLNEMD